MYVFLGFFYTFSYILSFLYIYIPLVFFVTVFFACNSAFEQGHLEPWRYINDFIIIILCSWFLDEDWKDCIDLPPLCPV